MARELHLSSQPVQGLRHLEGTLGRLLTPWPQSMGSLPLLLLPEIPAGEKSTCNRHRGMLLVPIRDE